VPALERVQPHRVASGETLAAIAAAYDLLPATLLAMNPTTQNGVEPGQTLRIPPFNGTEVQGTAGRTWTELATLYQVRADVLFEINGCLSTPPDRLFVPGVSAFTSGVRAESPTAIAHPLTTYPLGATLPLVMGYGWQPHPTEARLVFNSGVTLAATQPVTVQAAGAGTVAYAGPHEGLGLLVVINHDQGFQTRYGQVGDVQVAAGDRVAAGGAIARLVPTAETPAYLYFEVRTNSDLGWVARNPGDYLPELAVR
jgi:murein DD-endopeptidase MepM/ murein hydrolase activator NlpD